jgi:branched-chain amino acid transport system substrate-binding protein
MFAAAALILALTLPGAAEDPITVNAIMSLTGPGAFIGQADKTAVELGIEVINKHGGVRGRQLKLNILDDQSLPPQTVALMGQLIGKTQFVVGPAITATCAAVVPMLRNGPVSYCLSPGINPPAGGFSFSSGNNNDDNQAVFIRYFREKGWKRVGVITTTDATGQAVDHGIQLAMNLLENRSMQIVAYEHFGLGDVSVNAQISRIKAANPDVVVAWANGTPFGTLLRGIQDVGLTVPIGVSAGNLIFEQLKQVAPMMPRNNYFTGSPAMVPNAAAPPKVREARALMDAAYHAVGQRPNFVSISNWDPMFLIADALRARGADASAEQIRSYIATLHDWSGVNGIYDFRDGSQRGVGQDSAAIVRYDASTDRIILESRPRGYLL